MSIARDLVKLIRRLRRRPERFDPFATGAQDVVGTALREARLDPPGADTLAWDRVALLVAQALEIEQTARPVPARAEFVVTLPAGQTTAARRTSGVIAEMLRDAREEVFALGYEISDEDVIAHLHEAARRARLVLICDRARGSGPALLQSWPADLPAPVVWQDRAREGAPVYTSMHGKALLVDGRDLLITSANFTFHGTRANIEFGIRLRDASVEEAAAVFRDLLQSRLVERVARR